MFEKSIYLILNAIFSYEHLFKNILKSECAVIVLSSEKKPSFWHSTFAGTFAKYFLLLHALILYGSSRRLFNNCVTEIYQ